MAFEQARFLLPQNANGAPRVEIVSPSDGDSISPSTAITIDVTSRTGNFALVSLNAYFAASGAREVIWQNGFSPWYSGSTRSAISNGYRFVIRRSLEGWPSSPTFNVDAVDDEGQAN